MGNRKPPERSAEWEAERAAAIKNVRSDGSIDPEFITIPGWDNDDEASAQWEPGAEEEPDEEFAVELVRDTQLYPVLIVKEGDKIESLDGRTRIKALRWWNEQHPESTIKIHYEKVSGVSVKDRARRIVISNEHRRPKSIIVKAKMCVRLHERFGESWRDIADLYRVTLQTVEAWVSSLDMAPEIQAALDAGLSKAQADHVADMSHADQAAALELAKETGASLAQVADDIKGVIPETRAPLRRRSGGSSHTPSSRPGVPEVREAIEKVDLSGITATEALQWVVGDRPNLLNPIQD